MATISLKASVDKKSNRVVFVESDEFFVDILFSFLTMPMGTITHLISNLSPKNGIGCINNLYKSVENIDVKYFRTEACKDMLLHPHNAAAAYCKSLKLKIDDADTLSFFCCENSVCSHSRYKLWSHYKNIYCGCGRPMSRILNLPCPAPSNSGSDERNRGVFVKGLAPFVVSDYFQVMPASISASISLLTKLGVMDTSNIEERIFDIGVTEVLELLQCSLVSRTPLTEVLLARKEVPELRNKGSLQRTSLMHEILEHQSKRNGETFVRLVVCKSKKVVCYAEASKDFVDLLFSFLTIPLGYLMNKKHGGQSKGSIHHLYDSVIDLDAMKYLKSNDIKEILLNPKIAPGSGYKNQPLGVKEAVDNQQYYLDRNVIRTESKNPQGSTLPLLTIMDPKSPFKEGTEGDGFLLDPAMFTVSDDLVVTPISPVSELSLLEKLKIPFNDIYVTEVQVGKEEASRLFAASFISESALTDTFIRKMPKDAFISDVLKK
ncbi:PREDICTED: uncharacterized protein LOC105133096 [Populus euphratica]|uniref:Uncharacterized protein LOC105133096 n=1 Tax=Populus euphratica TaxID=75702 RepID=A0AAJ6XXZ8_POPEU|nr:PREDICTED: uncharacterized protein LOC105133096 [Populus euphratica]